MAESSADLVDRLFLSIKESLDRHSSSIRKVVEADITLFHDKLIECGLLYQISDKTCDNIMKMVSAGLELSKDSIEQLEEFCQKFLVSLLALGEKESITLSRSLRHDWNSLAIKLGLPESFLKKETSQAEVIKLITEAKCEFKFEASNKHRQQPFQHRHNPSNKSAQDFEACSDTIVDVLFTNSCIIVPFANKVCEARIISSGVRDQLLKIQNKLIQAKGIVGAVHKVLSRGVNPRIFMINLIRVLKFYREVDLRMNRVIAKLEKCFPTSVKEFKKPIQIVSKKDQICELRELKKLSRTDLPQDPLRRSLFLKYEKMKPAANDLISSYCEWKFFEVAALENVATIEAKQHFGPLDLFCLPHSDEYPPRSLISGGPGTGKSSIITELCKRWYNGDLLGEYEYVILLQADDPQVKNAAEIIDLAPKGHEKWFDPIIEANGANTLFIIDGYDEFSEESRKRNGLFDQIIQGKCLAEVSLILTARPWCAKQLLPHFTSQVEVLGFTPASREEYIRYQLDASDFDEFVIQKPLEECTAIPLLLATLIKIFKEAKTRSKELETETHGEAKKYHAANGFIPKTQTKLFGSLVRTLMLQYVYKREHLQKFLPENIEIAPGEFSSLPRNIYMPFMAVCIHAYHSLTSSSSTCDCSLPETFDLFTQSQTQTTSGTSISYKFLHSTIQEYLAAYCISCLEQSTMENCIKDMKKNHRYYLILEFLHGFNCVKVGAIANNYYTVVHNFSVFRQLCEVETHESAIQSIYQNSQAAAEPCVVKRSWPNPSPEDFWCLGRVIAFSGCEWELGFTLRPIQNNHLMMLQRGMESVTEQPESCRGRIKKLGLSLTKIKDLGFLANKSCSYIERIQLFENHFTSAVIPSICISLANLSRLSKFLFHHNDISPGDHKQLILALAENCKNLKHVTFTDLQSDECRILLHELKSLKTLELWRISTSSCESVFDSIYKSKSALEELEIHQSEVTYESIKHLPKVLPESRIKTLKLNNCRINCQCVSIIALAVSCPSCILELLDLSDNAIEDDGGRQLLKLRHIDLGDTHKFNKFSTRVIKALEEKKQLSNKTIDN